MIRSTPAYVPACWLRVPDYVPTAGRISPPTWMLAKRPYWRLAGGPFACAGARFASTAYRFALLEVDSQQLHRRSLGAGASLQRHHTSYFWEQVFGAGVPRSKEPSGVELFFSIIIIFYGVLVISTRLWLKPVLKPSHHHRIVPSNSGDDQVSLLVREPRSDNRPYHCGL